MRELTSKMLVASLVTLAVAAVATFFSINTNEEVFKVAMGFTAALAALLTLIFAPWIMKLVIVGGFLASSRLNYWTAENSNN